MLTVGGQCGGVWEGSAFDVVSGCEPLASLLGTTCLVADWRSHLVGVVVAGGRGEADRAVCSLPLSGLHPIEGADGVSK